MRGSYKGFSYGVYYCSVFFIILFPMIAGVTKSAAAVGVLFVIAVGGGAGLMMYASSIPCRVRADETGFTITEMGFENRFEYESIDDISFKYVHGRLGGMVKLTIKHSGLDESVFCETCSQEFLTDLMNDPENDKCPQLVRLCRFVKQAKGAA
ncbi:MAG: hypothetical protein K6B74_10345 [Ruminococcus sp.]|nr:hypothetical protein [Ruminococcus sp.]